MAFKKSNSSAGEEFAARKRPALGPNDQIDVNDIETLKYYITDYGKILPARDNLGAVRLLDTAGIPFSPALKAFHRDKMVERAKFEKREISFQMVIDDIYAISKGRLVGRPR